MYHLLPDVHNFHAQDCFFACQKWCVGDCATSPTLSCRRPSYYLQVNGPGAPFPFTEAHSELRDK